MWLPLSQCNHHYLSTTSLHGRDGCERRRTKVAFSQNASRRERHPLCTPRNSFSLSSKVSWQSPLTNHQALSWKAVCWLFPTHLSKLFIDQFHDTCLTWQWFCNVYTLTYHIWAEKAGGKRGNRLGVILKVFGLGQDGVNIWDRVILKEKLKLPQRSCTPPWTSQVAIIVYIHVCPDHM